MLLQILYSAYQSTDALKPVFFYEDPLCTIWIGLGPSPGNGSGPCDGEGARPGGKWGRTLGQGAREVDEVGGLARWACRGRVKLPPTFILDSRTPQLGERFMWTPRYNFPKAPQRRTHRSTNVSCGWPPLFSWLPPKPHPRLFSWLRASPKGDPSRCMLGCQWMWMDGCLMRKISVCQRQPVC